MAAAGSCNLSRYGATAVHVPSKAELIMARYRPIAPKPPPPPLPSTFQPAVCSSVIPFDCTPSSSSVQSSIVTANIKRTIKRPKSSIAAPSHRLRKKTRLTGDGEVGAVSVHRNGPLQVVAISGSFPAASFARYGLSEGFFPGEASSLSLEFLQGRMGIPNGYTNLQSRPRPTDMGSGREAVSNACDVQVGDMGSIISAPSRPCSLQQGDTGSVNRSTDMVLNLREEYSSSVLASGKRGSPFFASCGQQCKGNEEDATLPLLPNVPSRGDSSPTISTCSSQACLSSPVSSDTGVSACSLAYIQKLYMDSPAPVLVVDQDHMQKVLWMNKACEKAAKAKQMANPTLAPAFIDPLGIPVQLGRFILQLDDSHSGRQASAILWGFLERLIATDAHGMHTNQLSNFWSSGATLQRTENTLLAQPITWVGSFVSLNSITEIDTRKGSTAALETVELAREYLEREVSLPALLTETSEGLVRWANTAYKQMVEASNAPCNKKNTPMGTTQRGTTSSPIFGEALLECNVNVPSSFMAFSGRANVQWKSPAGKKRSMTLPCDVWPVVVGMPPSPKQMLVWKFDSQAGLSLKCP